MKNKELREGPSILITRRSRKENRAGVRKWKMFSKKSWESKHIPKLINISRIKKPREAKISLLKIMSWRSNPKQRASSIRLMGSAMNSRVELMQHRKDRNLSNLNLKANLRCPKHPLGNPQSRQLRLPPERPQPKAPSPPKMTQLTFMINMTATVHSMTQTTYI